MKVLKMLKVNAIRLLKALKMLKVNAIRHLKALKTIQVNAIRHLKAVKTLKLTISMISYRKKVKSYLKLRSLLRNDVKTLIFPDWQYRQSYY